MESPLESGYMQATPIPSTPVTDTRNNPTRIRETRTENMQNNVSGSLRLQARQLRVSTWNVQSLMRERHQGILTEDLDGAGVDVCLMHEIRIPSSGMRQLPGTMDSHGRGEDYMMIWHGAHEDDPGKYGVGIAFKKHLRGSLLGYELLSPYLVKARFRGTPFNTMFLAAYIPTCEEGNAARREQVLRELDACMRSVPRSEFLVLSGNFNTPMF